jgi:hypothetical protein
MIHIIPSRNASSSFRGATSYSFPGASFEILLRNISAKSGPIEKLGLSVLGAGGCEGLFCGVRIIPLEGFGIFFGLLLIAFGSVGAPLRRNCSWRVELGVEKFGLDGSPSVGLFSIRLTVSEVESGVVLGHADSPSLGDFAFGPLDGQLSSFELLGYELPHVGAASSSLSVSSGLSLSFPPP